MRATAKITPDDYDDLLAASEAGVSQRELARRYNCAPSLITRHLARAQQSRERDESVNGRDAGVPGEPQTASLREILEAHIRNPRTSPRDVASLATALARLDEREPVERVRVVTVDADGKVIESALPWAPPGVTLVAPDRDHLAEEGISEEDAGGLIAVFPVPPDLDLSNPLDHSCDGAAEPGASNDAGLESTHS